MPDGVLTRDSPFAFADTLERIERAIVERGLTLFAKIDHCEAARQAGLAMQPTTVLVFGNPRIGTPAMLAEPLAALDLPLRALVWEQDGRVRVSYQQPAFVAARFGIPAEIPAHAETLIDSALG